MTPRPLPPRPRPARRTRPTARPDALSTTAHDPGPVPPPPDPGGERGGSLRIRLDLGYDGTGFSGWATQPGRRTVAGVLAEGLATVLRTPPAALALVVAGRTDAGVHATGQVCHVDLPERGLGGPPGPQRRPARGRSGAPAPGGPAARRAGRPRGRRRSRLRRALLGAAPPVRLPALRRPRRRAAAAPARRRGLGPRGRRPGHGRRLRRADRAARLRRVLPPARGRDDGPDAPGVLLGPGRRRLRGGPRRRGRLLPLHGPCARGRRRRRSGRDGAAGVAGGRCWRAPYGTPPPSSRHRTGSCSRRSSTRPTASSPPAPRPPAPSVPSLPLTRDDQGKVGRPTRSVRRCGRTTFP